MFSQFVVKKPGHNTGKKPKRFTNDLTQRHAERKILQYAMTEVDEEMNRSGFTLEPQTSSRGSGEYTLIIDIDWEEDQNGECFSMITVWFTIIKTPGFFGRFYRRARVAQ